MPRKLDWQNLSVGHTSQNVYVKADNETTPSLLATLAATDRTYLDIQERAVGTVLEYTVESVGPFKGATITRMSEPVTFTITSDLPNAPLNMKAMSPTRLDTQITNFFAMDKISSLDSLPFFVFFDLTNIQLGDSVVISSTESTDPLSMFYGLVETSFVINSTDITNGYIACNFRPQRWVVGSTTPAANYKTPITGNLSAKIVQVETGLATASITKTFTIDWLPYLSTSSGGAGSVDGSILSGTNAQFPNYTVKNTGNWGSYDIASRADYVGPGVQFGERGYAWNAHNSYFEIVVKSLPATPLTGKLYGNLDIPYPFIGYGERANGSGMAWDSIVIEGTANFAGLIAGNGRLYNAPGGGFIEFAGRNLAVGDVVGIQVEQSQGKAHFYLNGVFKVTVSLWYRQEYITATGNTRATYTVPSVFVNGAGYEVELKLFKSNWTYPQADYNSLI